MPSFFNLEFSVVRFKPSRAAAPFAPAMTPFFGFAQHAKNMFALAGFECRIFFGRGFWREVELGKRHSQGRAFCKNHGALDEVLKLRLLPCGASILRRAFIASGGTDSICLSMRRACLVTK